MGMHITKNQILAFLAKLGFCVSAVLTITEGSSVLVNILGLIGMGVSIYYADVLTPDVEEDA